MGLGKDAVGISLGTVGKGRLPTDCQPEVQKKSSQHSMGTGDSGR